MRNKTHNIRWFVSIVLLLCSVGVSRAQVTLNQSNTTVREILKEIERTSVYRFFYNENLEGLNSRVSVNVTNASIENALQAVLNTVPIAFNLQSDNVYTLSPRQQQPARNVPRNISGTVRDESGQPVLGAAVVVKGTQTGVITNTDGGFTITVPNDSSFLLVSFLGFEETEVQAAPNMTVTLKSSATTIEEVVVTGMTTMDRRLFTGATDRLLAEDIKLDGLADISRGLEGRSAGVSIQNVSGTFGTAPKIRVRGATSIYGSSKPLWVVDGIIVEDVLDVDSDALSSGDAETLISSAIAGLNADDIESFQILKDGSATSIYGARAMAGVIVVTTKKGRPGVVQVSYSGEFTSRLVPTYGSFNIMNSQEQMSVYQDMENKGWLNFASVYRAKNSGVYGKMYQLMNTYDPVTGTYALPNTASARNAYLREAEMRNTDWFKELFDMSISQTHSIGISGGTDKATFYTSMSAMADPGWSVASKVNRYTANMNTTYKVFKNVTLNLISNASYRKQKAPGTLNQNLDAVRGEVQRDFDINPYSYAMNTSRALDANEFYTRNYASFNIMDELKQNYMDIEVTDVKFQGELKWRIIPELELSALGAFKHTGSTIEHHIKDDSNQARAYRAMDDESIIKGNNLLYDDPDWPYELPISILPNGGIYQRTDSKMNGFDFRTSLTWSKIFNNIHHTHFYAGMEINSLERQSTWFRGWGRQYTKGNVPFYAYEVFKKSVEEATNYYTVDKTTVRSAAFFGTATYSYKAKYIINGTARYEGTNRLGRSRSARWLPTWNVGAAWNIHEETFFNKFNGILSHAALKASYSLTADRGPASVSNSLVILKSQIPWRPGVSDYENSLYIDYLENSELTYEKKHEFNAGIALGFLRNRINVEFDVYTRNNFDLIGYINTQGVGGTVSKQANVAEMKSHGFEFSLSSRNINHKDFRWDTNVIFSKTKGKVTKLDTRTRVIDLVTNYGFAKEGYAHRALFSIPFAGLTDTGLPSFYDENGEITVTGINFQERENTDFLIYEGPSEPTIMTSLGNTFTYKGFRLNIFITGSFGNKIRLDPVFSSSYSDLSATPKEFKNRWMAPGDELYTDVPVIASAWQSHNISNLRYAYNAYNYSTARVADGGFIRMKEISLMYDFPKKLTEPIKANSLSLKLQATNPFLIYADKKLNGQDPEFFNSGGVAAPIPRQFTLTLRIGF